MKSKRNIPVSRLLPGALIIYCIIITCFGIKGLFSAEHKHRMSSQALTVFFGLSTLILGWLLLDKRVVWKERKKLYKSDRLLQLPFRAYTAFFIFLISSFLVVGGITSIYDDQNMRDGLPMLLIGVVILLLIMIAVEHPKIWFSDTLSLDEIDEKTVEFTADGVFTYKEDAFTIQLDDKERAIRWNDITLIQAYKIDQLTFDTIVIEIHLADTYITIHDETPGYIKFMETASGKLTGFKNNWFEIVAFPAFETNLTIIYKR